MRFTVAFALCLAALPTAASGGLSCSADDENAVISIESGVARGMGAGLFAFGSDIEIKDQRVRRRLRHTHFEGEHVPQYWLEAKTLMLRLYRETEGNEPHAYVEMVMKTLFNDDGEGRRGEYAIRVYDTGRAGSSQIQLVELAGTISCFVE